MHLKLLLQNAALSGAVLVFFFILLEGGLRLTNVGGACYVYPEGMFQEDEQLCYAATPDFTGRIVSPEYDTRFTTDGRGNRDDGHDSAAGKRILVLGDSFTFGVGVEDNETFSAVLEQLLNGTHEVINTGVPSYDTRRENAYLRENFARIQPEMVLLAFYNNDINDNMNRECTTHVRKGYLVDKRTAEQPSPIFNVKIFLNTNVQSYCVLKDNALNILSRFRDADSDNAIENSMLAYFSRENYTGDTARMWERTKELLKETKAITDAHDTPLILVNIPDQLQVEGTHIWEKIQAKHGVTRDDFDMEKLDRLLSVFGEENNIMVIDPLPRLREAAKNRTLYYDFDRHTNAAAHRIIAETAYDHYFRIPAPRDR